MLVALAPASGWNVWGRNETMNTFDFIRSHALALPPLTKFALAMAIIFGVPLLSRRVRLPAAVGLLLSGVLIGPHVLDVYGTQRPTADFLRILANCC